MEKLNHIQIENLEAGLEKRIKKAVEPYVGETLALSGGVDSSLLAALIKPKLTVSVQLPGGDKYNETQYSRIVANYLNLKRLVVRVDQDRFHEAMKEAVPAIGRPIPHFNIFPLFEMYRNLHELGVETLVLGDGPDETMAGYGRDLIYSYLYGIYSFASLEPYWPLIAKVLPPPEEALSRMTGRSTEEIEALTRGTSILEKAALVDVYLMRDDMDDMSNRLAAHFGITNVRPYQDDVELDAFMMALPLQAKIKDHEYGKYLLRKIASKYLPHEIAWRGKKVGGPVYPVNKIMGWMENGEFDKTRYLAYQEEILRLK